VGSLWPLRDRDSAALMQAFYRHLAQGLPVGTALAAAKRDRIRAGAPAAAWAGVVVLGSGARVPWPERVTSPQRLGTVLLVAVLAALAAMLVLRRRRRA
jgi:hypothetical protein